MAFTYERKDSPWVWICFLDDLGKRRRQATEIRRNTPDTNRKARRLEAEYTQKENDLPRRTAKEDAWENWVPGYLAKRSKSDAQTLKRAKNAWTPLAHYFESKGIRAPRGVDYVVVSGYMDWRRSAKSGLRIVAHNTARLELSYLRLILAEAVRLSYMTSNPCRELEIGREDSKKKREITEAEEKQIEAGLVDAPAWMRESWQIYMRQGCRLIEVEVPLDRIAENAEPVPTITFRLKGGRMHTAPLHPELLPLVRKARDEKRSVLVKVDPSASKLWTNFFAKLKIKDLSLHCTRVTVITRLIRAGADQVRVREYIGHSSDAIQAIYRRLRPSDASSLTKFLGGPGSTPSSENPDDPGATAPRGPAS